MVTICLDPGHGGSQPGAVRQGVLVLRQARPACLVECFFLSNLAERALLKQARVRGQLAEAIAWGCGNFIATIRDRT